MKISNKYLQVFVRMALLSGCFFAVLMSLKFGILSGILAGLKFGILFPAAVLIIFVIINNLSKNKLPVDALDVNQGRDIQVHGDVESVLKRIVEIIRKTSFIKGRSIQERGDVIKARTKSTWSSLGEIITVEFDLKEADLITIHISSYPSLSTTVFDFGKNFKNVEYIVSEMNKEFSSQLKKQT